MQHLQPDAITALALGEHDEEAAAHLRTCPVCAAEADSLRAAADRMRAAAVPSTELPAGIWEKIDAELDAFEAPSPAHAEAPRVTVAASELPLQSESSARSESPLQNAQPRRPLMPGRRRKGGRSFGISTLMAASAASAFVAAGAVWLALSPLGEPDAVQLAAVELEALQPLVTPANAQVVERDGQRLLVLETEALPDVDGYLDVWLIDSDVDGMVSIGTLDAQTTEIVLPPGLELEGFPIVDVSIEPFDGDPTHSGDSIWRGTLEL